jgi:hypothetical protein
VAQKQSDYFLLWPTVLFARQQFWLVPQPTSHADLFVLKHRVKHPERVNQSVFPEGLFSDEGLLLLPTFREIYPYILSHNGWKLFLQLTFLFGLSHPLLFPKRAFENAVENFAAIVRIFAGLQFFWQQFLRSRFADRGHGFDLKLDRNF